MENRKRHTARGITSPGGGYPSPVLARGEGYPSPGWLGVPILGYSPARTGVPPWLGLGYSPERTWDQRLGYLPPQKGHETRGWEGTWDQRLGYPPEMACDQRLGRDLPGVEDKQSENIIFPRTTYAGGNKY